MEQSVSLLELQPQCLCANLEYDFAQWDGSAVIAQLESLSEALFIAYDPAFYKLLGINGYNSTKNLENIFTFPPAPSFINRQIHDATVYVPEVKAFFFAELHSPNPGYSTDPINWLWKIDVADPSKPITSKVYSKPSMIIANGAYYYQGSPYFLQEGNVTHPGGVIRMNPHTLETTLIKNNFYGHRFNSPNDLIIRKDGVAFFTDGYYGDDNFNDSLIALLSNGIYRWDMNTDNTKMVYEVGDTFFLNPNGLAFNAEQSILYTTSRGNSSDDPAGARNIFSYDVTATDIKNRELFAYTGAGFPNGVKTDFDGNVYGFVTGGVDVFNSVGTLLGKIKVKTNDVAVNGIFVDDWLYIMGRGYIYKVQLAAKGVPLY